MFAEPIKLTPKFYDSESFELCRILEYNARWWWYLKTSENNSEIIWLRENIYIRLVVTTASATTTKITEVSLIIIVTTTTNTNGPRSKNYYIWKLGPLNFTRFAIRTSVWHRSSAWRYINYRLHLITLFLLLSTRRDRLLRDVTDLRSPVGNGVSPSCVGVYI